MKSHHFVGMKTAVVLTLLKVFLKINTKGLNLIDVAQILVEQSELCHESMNAICRRLVKMSHVSNNGS